MAIRGANEKLEIQKKILEMFPGAFPYDKHIRVPMGDVQIKITLTAAKDILGGGNATNVSAPAEAFPDPGKKMSTPAFTEPTEEEKETLKNLLDSLA